MHWIKLNWIKLNCIELNCSELDWIELNCIELHWIKLNEGNSDLSNCSSSFLTCLLFSFHRNTANKSDLAGSAGYAAPYDRLMLPTILLSHVQAAVSELPWHGIKSGKIKWNKVRWDVMRLRWDGMRWDEMRFLRWKEIRLD